MTAIAARLQIVARTREPVLELQSLGAIFKDALRGYVVIGYVE